MRKFSLISVILALVGVFLFITLTLTLGIFLLVLSIITGILALRNIKKKKEDPKNAVFVVAAMFISLIPLLIALFVMGGFWLQDYSGRFKECDANEVISMIKDNYAIELPDKMEDVRAAKGAAYGMDPTNLYLFKFSTDSKGWEQFRKSVLSAGSDGNSVNEDPFWDLHDNSDEPKIFSDSRGTPKWYKEKIAKGKSYMRQISSKKNDSLIYGIYVDLAESDDIKIYMAIAEPMK